MGPIFKISGVCMAITQKLWKMGLYFEEKTPKLPLQMGRGFELEGRTPAQTESEMYQCAIELLKNSHFSLLYRYITTFFFDLISFQRMVYLVFL